DAGPATGTGHVMRCLALAQAWQEAGGDATLASAHPLGGLESRLHSDGIGNRYLAASTSPGSLQNAEQKIALASLYGEEWIVLDGYVFSSSYQRALKSAGLRLLVLDDFGHAEHYCADLVLNQNLHAHERLYARREADTRLLLGTRFALLRREFTRWQE